MTNKIMPCSIDVFPVLNVRIITRSDSRKRTVDSTLMPSASGNPVKTDTRATVGKVNPMLARAEPKERLRLFCNWFFRAALTAEIPSGNKIIKAMITPEREMGAPTDWMNDVKCGAMDSASSTTTIRFTGSSIALRMVIFKVGFSSSSASFFSSF